MKIHWMPTADAKTFDTGGANELSSIMDIFGPVLRMDDAPILRKMARVSGKPFYAEVAACIERAGMIKIWGEG